MAHAIRARNQLGHTPRFTRGFKVKVVLSGLAAMHGAFISLTPPGLKGPMVTIIVLIALDTITGVIASFYERRFFSHQLRTKTAGKLAIYTAFAVAFWFISLALDAWYLMSLIITWIGLTEVASIKENVNRLERCEVPLGPISMVFKALDDVIEAITKRNQKSPPPSPPTPPVS